MTANTNWISQTLTEVVTLGELDVPEYMYTTVDKEKAGAYLEEIIAFLIDKNFEKLLWILYRIDVDESKAKALLAHHLPDEAPKVLAALILQRQEQKAAFKASFEQNHPPSKEDEDLLL